MTDSLIEELEKATEGSRGPGIERLAEVVEHFAKSGWILDITAGYEEGAKELAAALSAAGLEVVEDWQPIDNAPDTGKVIVFGGRFTVPEERHADGEWWRYNRDAGSRSGPTFWRHMPEPPAHALTQGEG